MPVLVGYIPFLWANEVKLLFNTVFRIFVVWYFLPGELFLGPFLDLTGWRKLC